jgi:small basic protein (TIGR04137 family)
MSIHPSFRMDTAGNKQRSVLSRIERIKDLMKRGLWVDGQTVTALPKTKIVKIKARKETKAAAEGAEGAAPAAGAPAGKAAAPAAKAAAPAAKAAPAKDAKK